MYEKIEKLGSLFLETVENSNLHYEILKSSIIELIDWNFVWMILGGIKFMPNLKNISDNYQVLWNLTLLEKLPEVMSENSLRNNRPRLGICLFANKIPNINLYIYMNKYL